MSREFITSEQFREHAKDDAIAFANIIDRIEDAEEERRKRHEDVMKMLEKMVETNKPMLETYKTATTLGKWMMAAAVFVSICIGIIIALKDFIKK